ncbi:Phosphorylated carbohydrates phosphatase [Rubripirellula lacrimiformis]|uniref:Phosphorylated carbohydrates phosphatase n=1 Tax=Rubripirellula lacrimiformis TaxID=1930273 RepID=A0A517NAC6_9BACT|nr:HAD-IA family hydrolase [Rubripirellula lacrimiformis]QDT04083.1 Phosphorylated carbohydrates phosphatase [Rubripirellula lacrimiformis]
MHNPILGVALDMDGLLFDTERLFWAVGDTVLSRRGHRFSHELQQRMMGRVGVAAMQQMIDFHELDDSPDDLLMESDELYYQQLSGDIQPMPGLQSWIDFLKQMDIPFGIATSSRRRFVDIILPSVDWHSDLTFVLTGDDVSRGKPHPEMYLSAANHLDIPAASMLVLEDSGNGCAAAVAAGAYTVAIPSQHTRGQSFDGAQLVADSLTDTRLWDIVRQGWANGSDGQ